MSWGKFLFHARDEQIVQEIQSGGSHALRRGAVQVQKVIMGQARPRRGVGALYMKNHTQFCFGRMESEIYMKNRIELGVIADFR